MTAHVRHRKSPPLFCLERDERLMATCPGRAPRLACSRLAFAVAGEDEAY